MPENSTFVINDRRKFTSEGELRHDSPVDTPASASLESSSEAPAAEAAPPASTQTASPQATSELADLPEAGAIAELYPDTTVPDQDDDAALEEFPPQSDLPPGPTEEQSAEAARAYAATVDRLDIAMRAANPGGERMPEMTFERLVQSLYTQALLLLGGAAEPGETPRVDILGARQTIDMLSVLSGSTKGNLSDAEDKLLQSALFDLHMGFLEITQALARQAAQRQNPGPGGMPPAGAGPRIVR